MECRKITVFDRGEDDKKVLALEPDEEENNQEIDKKFADDKIAEANRRQSQKGRGIKERGWVANTLNQDLLVEEAPRCGKCGAESKRHGKCMKCICELCSDWLSETQSGYSDVEVRI